MCCTSKRDTGQVPVPLGAGAHSCEGSTLRSSMFSTSLRSKFRTNEPPSIQETAEVKRVFGIVSDRVQALENEIAFLLNKRDALEIESRKLEDFMDGHNRLLSPARKLLPEILQEIFFHCLPVAHNAVLDSREAPLLLGRICSQWRRIAYSTPRLWTSIHIFAHPISPTYPSTSSREIARKEAISSWLSRSGILPLSISMYCNGITASSMTGEPINSEIQPYLDVVISHAHRWRAIHFTLRYFDWLPFFSEFSSRHFPLLESLHIDGDFEKDLTPPSPVGFPPLKGDNILQGPLLRILSLPRYTLFTLILDLQWDRLTGLDLGGSNLFLGDITRALKLCPNLEFCSIAAVPGPHHLTLMGSPSSYDMSEITLAKLRALTVINRSGLDEASRQIFSSLSAPSLRHLSYERTCHVYPDSPGVRDSELLLADAIRSFLQRLIQPLEELSIWTNPFHGSFVMDVLPLVPELKRLSLKGYATYRSDPTYSSSSLILDGPMDDFFLGELMPGRIQRASSPATHDANVNDIDDSDENFLYRPCICPRLEVLHCSDALFSDSMLLDFLCSRSVDSQRNNVAHLRRVGITFSSTHPRSNEDPHMEFVDRIDKLEKETGLRVDIRHTCPEFHPLASPLAPPVIFTPYDGIGYPFVVPPAFLMF